MKVTIVGAGSAGLSTAIVIKGQFNADVTILEQAKENDTPGLGVALLPYALNELRKISSEGSQSYVDSFLLIDHVTEIFAGHDRNSDLIKKYRAQDTQYWGVKRSTLLAFLTEAAQRAGVKIEYDCNVSEYRVRQERELSDLLIGADGAGSVVRNTYSREFIPRGEESKSRYAWLELDGTLDHFIFGYIYVVGKGLIRISAYPHSKQESSAIITHSRGLTNYFDEADMIESDGSISESGMKAINAIFANGLGGRKLTGKSRWRRFRATHCQRAAFGTVALVGDAYATLHYETGWGTSTAIQESKTLIHALVKGKTVEDGLEIYNTKSIEITRGAITATTRTMREIDGQSARFFQLGAAKFLRLRTP